MKLDFAKLMKREKKGEQVRCKVNYENGVDESKS